MLMVGEYTIVILNCIFTLYCTCCMRETVRLVAHDIVLIGGALCIIIVLILLAIWLRISYTWLQTGKAIK